MTQPSFFDGENQLAKIHRLNGFLPKLQQLIDFEQFRSELEVIRNNTPKEHGGRPAYDVVLMFKILVLKFLYNMSDENTELQIRDRLSFQHFLGLTLADRFPDAKTIWLFGEQLRQHNIERKLFDRLLALLASKGYTAKEGSIVDSTFVEVPKQRNTKEENEQIKQGEVPETLRQNKHQLAQKDCDARWTKKGNTSYFGYKNHVKTDVHHKLIRAYEVTPASVHDSKVFMDFFPLRDEEDKKRELSAEDRVYADSAYVSHEDALRERGYEPLLCERNYRNRKLTEEQKCNNKEKSKVRCRIEHVFGVMKARARDEVMRCVGMARAVFQIGMRNVIYNMCRWTALAK